MCRKLIFFQFTNNPHYWHFYACTKDECEDNLYCAKIKFEPLKETRALFPAKHMISGGKSITISFFNVFLAVTRNKVKDVVSVHTVVLAIKICHYIGVSMQSILIIFPSFRLLIYLTLQVSS